MKLGNAAALALVGWYLMVPLSPKNTLPYDPSTNLWQIQRTFLTEADCEASSGKLKRDPARLSSVAKRPICVESKDDPDFR